MIVRHNNHIKKNKVMITENYVSLETAKLLKKKGFDAECWEYYDNNKSFKSSICDYDLNNIEYPYWIVE